MGQDLILVIGAALAYFFFSGFYYAIIGDARNTAWGVVQTRASRRDPVPYLVAFIGCLWASYGMYILFKHIHPKNILEAQTVTLGTWLFILVGTSIKHYVFSGVKLKAFALDYLGDCIGFLLMGYLLFSK